MIAVVDQAIDSRAVADAVRDRRHGAVLVFEGVARDHHDGKQVVSLFYEAYVPMALREMEAIAVDTRARWPGVSVAMVHRTGPCAIGEPSVVIAVGAAHRGEAYEASRHAIDELKLRVPVWKREHYADGSAWIANKV
ncbi:MAG: molybdenum cofactor biosynthesis protein MoaE [Deltaproteobacteria bacterium]|nr:molybdenum cofactor biosynthesis protein MoaE [Deltaproteobacteria bacterium]